MYKRQAPDRGKVLYDGRDFVSMSRREQVVMRREMGMVFQNSALFDSLSVLENVMFPLDMFSTKNYRERVKRAQECLELSLIHICGTGDLLDLLLEKLPTDKREELEEDIPCLLYTSSFKECVTAH